MLTGTHTYTKSNWFGHIGTMMACISNLLLLFPGNVEAIMALAAGYWHTCALLSSGSVMCWGGNAGGQLGIGSNSDTYTPKAVNLGTGLSCWFHKN
jgi:alpha-tubulin suppressor-like RCC1 family protein